MHVVDVVMRELCVWYVVAVPGSPVVVSCPSIVVVVDVYIRQAVCDGFRQGFKVAGGRGLPRLTVGRNIC